MNTTFFLNETTFTNYGCVATKKVHAFEVLVATFYHQEPRWQVQKKIRIKYTKFPRNKCAVNVISVRIPIFKSASSVNFHHGLRTGNLSFYR